MPRVGDQPTAILSTRRAPVRLCQATARGLPVSSLSRAARRFPPNPSTRTYELGRRTGESPKDILGRLMHRKSLIAALAAVSMGAANAAASVVNACGIGAADAEEIIDGGAQRSITAGESLIDSHPAHLTLYRVALNRSIEGSWDTAIAPILPNVADESIAMIGDTVEASIEFRTTTNTDVPVWKLPDGITTSLQINAEDLDLLPEEVVTPRSGT